MEITNTPTEALKRLLANASIATHTTSRAARGGPDSPSRKRAQAARETEQRLRDELRSRGQA